MTSTPRELDSGTTADALDVLTDAPTWALTPSRWDDVAGDLGTLVEALRHNDFAEARAAVARLRLAEPARVTRIGAEPTVPAPEPVRERIALLVHTLLGAPPPDEGDGRARRPH